MSAVHRRTKSEDRTTPCENGVNIVPESFTMAEVRVTAFRRIEDALAALREAEWEEFKREIGAPADAPLEPPLNTEKPPAAPREDSGQ